MLVCLLLVVFVFACRWTLIVVVCGDCGYLLLFIVWFALLVFVVVAVRRRSLFVVRCMLFVVC